MQIANVIDIEEGLGSLVTATAFGASTAIPLLYYFGYTCIEENKKYYTVLLNKLSTTVRSRQQHDADCIMNMLNSVICGDNH